MLELAYVMSIRRRHGRIAYYYRRSGRLIPISGEPNSAEFLTEYARIHSSFEAEGRPADAPGTFGELLTEYLADPAFTGLADKTKAEYRRYFDKARAAWERRRVEAVDRAVIRGLRNKLADKPSTANHALSALQLLFAYGVSEGFVKENPVQGLKRVKIDSVGWEPWPEEDLTKFKADAKCASRIAFFLALYTGQRIGDCLAMTRGKIKDGGVEVKQEKTGQEVWIPLHADLKTELDAAPKNGLSLVQRLDGQPYTKDGFYSVWQREMTRLGIKRQIHGLRKNATIALIEAGCSPDEVMAITGHKTDAMVRHYSAGASRKKMAKQAMERLEDKGDR